MAVASPSYSIMTSSSLSTDQNDNLYKQYYENYWHNTPSMPVVNK